MSLHPYQQDVGRAGRSQGSDNTGGGAAALAAATLVTSKYILSLQSSKHVVATTTPLTSTDSSIVPDHRPTKSRARRHVGLSCCGRDAADAAVSVGNPEFMAILEAWEAAATAAAATGTEKICGSYATQKDCAAGAPRCVDAQKEGLVGNEESSSAVKEEKEDAGGASTNDGSDVASQEHQNEETKTFDPALDEARKVLRALDKEADPQAALCLGPANAWVVKPAGSSCGRGVEVVSTLRGLVSACRRLEWKAVVQKYVERPLLVQVSGRPCVG